MQIPRPQVVLLEASPRSLVDGSVVTVRFAGGGSDSPYRYLSQDWRAGLTSLPAVTASLGFDGDGWGAGAVPNVTALRWQPARVADLNSMAGYYWPDAAVTIYTGPDGGTPTAFLTGRIDNASVVDGGLQFTMADLSDDMGRPVLVSRFLGTGGIEGPTDWKDRIKRRAWGRCFNVEGEPIDKANLIYCFADPTKPLQAIDAVRDKGVAASSLTTVAWAGSVAATFAALQAATAPAGGGAIAPSIACVKWWIQPTLITADIRGEIGAGYVETIPAIVERIVADRAGPSFTAGTVTAAVGLRGAVGGVYVDDAGETLATVLDRELGAISLLWKVEAGGTITIAPWAFGSSVASLTSLDVQRSRTWAPHRGRAIGYQRNRREMTTGEIAPVLLWSDVAPSPGRPADNAGTTLILTAIGSSPPTVTGNSVTKSSGGVAFNSAAVATPQNASAFISARMATPGIKGVRLALDLLEANFAFASHDYYAQVDGASAWAFYAGGSLITSGASLPAGDMGGLFTLAYDGISVQFLVDGVLIYRHTGGVAKDLRLFPKVVMFQEDTLRDIQSGRYGQDNADVTAAAQVTVTVPALVTYDATYTGALIGSLSNESVRVARGGASIKLDNGTSYAITINGGITATIDNTNGSGTKGDIIPTAFAGNFATIDVFVTVDGVAQPKQTITFQKSLAAPPSTGGAGVSSAFDTSLSSISASTDTVMSDTLTVALASGQSLYGSAPLDCEVSGTTATTRFAQAKWQYSVAGANSWNDFVAATYVTGSNGASGFFSGGEWNDPSLGFIAVTQTKAGLGAGTYDVRLVGKLSATGRTMAFFGTATIEAKV